MRDSPDKITFLGIDGLIVVPILYVWATNLSKMVILCLYLRFILQPKTRVVIYIIFAVLALQTIVLTVMTILQCNPVHLLWTAMDRGDHCINIQHYFTFATLPHPITDVIMLILPLPTFWTLNTTRQVKIGLTLTFFSGSL